MSDEQERDGPGECPPVDVPDLERVLAALAGDPAGDAEASVGLVGSVLPDRPDYYRAAVIVRLMAFGAVFETGGDSIGEFMQDTEGGVVIGKALLTAVAQAPLNDRQEFDLPTLVGMARAAAVRRC